MTSETVSEQAETIAHDIAGDDVLRPAPHRPPAAPLDHAAVRAIVAGIMLAMFLSALEQTIVAPALPAIGKSLGGIDDLSWVVTAYLLGADRNDAVVRQAVRHLRPAHDSAFRHRDLHRADRSPARWRRRSGC